MSFIHSNLQNKMRLNVKICFQLLELTNNSLMRWMRLQSKHKKPNRIARGEFPLGHDSKGGVPINVSSKIFLFALSLWWCLRSLFCSLDCCNFSLTSPFSTRNFELSILSLFFYLFPSSMLGFSAYHFLVSVLLLLACFIFFFNFSSLFSELNCCRRRNCFWAW